MSTSAFGVDHGGISKADDKKRNRQGTALAAAGATTATTGLVAGGIPGAKSDFSSVFRVKEGTGRGAKRVATTIRGQAPAAKAVPGGILGFRTSAHKGGTAHFENVARENNKTKPKGTNDAFYRGHNEGKIAPEHRVMRGMARGRKASNALLGVGVAATAAGLQRRKPGKTDKVSKASAERKSDTYNSALLGAGTAGAALGQGVPKYLKGHQKAYEASAARNVDEASKLVPSLGGRKHPKMNMKQIHTWKKKNPTKAFPADVKRTMYPEVSDGDVSRKRKLKGVDARTAEAAGRLRGAATQERHFAEVFGSTAKAVKRVRTPSAIAAAAGAGGLAVNRDKKKTVSKSAPFGIEHG